MWENMCEEKVNISCEQNIFIVISCQAIIKVQENVIYLGVFRMNSSYEISISKINSVIVFVIWANYEKTRKIFLIWCSLGKYYEISLSKTNLVSLFSKCLKYNRMCMVEMTMIEMFQKKKIKFSLEAWKIVKV